MIWLIILVFVIIMVIEVPRLKKTRRIRELVFFCIFMAAGFILNLLLAVGVKLPNPVEGVISFLDKIRLHY